MQHVGRGSEVRMNMWLCEHLRIMKVTTKMMTPRPYEGHYRHQSIFSTHTVHTYIQDRAHILGGMGWGGSIILMKKGLVQWPKPTGTQLCFLLMEITQSGSSHSSSYLTLQTTPSQSVCMCVYDLICWYLHTHQLQLIHTSQPQIWQPIKSLNLADRREEACVVPRKLIIIPNHHKVYKLHGWVKGFGAVIWRKRLSKNSLANLKRSFPTPLSSTFKTWRGMFSQTEADCLFGF